MTKPTLLFVHGTWHSPQCWEKIIPKLEANGYKCIAPQCLHSGTSEPIDKLEPCIEQLQDILAAETSTGNDVILIGHSFGGVVSSSAVKGFTSQDPSKLKSKDSGKVIGLALMTAMVLPTGLSFGKYNAGGQPVNKGIGAPAGDGWTTLVPDPKECLYQDLPDKEAEKWAGLLKKQSFGPLIAENAVYAGWLDVPVWYLMCEKDPVFETAFQERMINDARKMGAKVEVRRTDAGHSLMLSRAEDSVKFVVDAAEAMSSRGRCQL